MAPVLPESQVVPVPELGGDVVVRPLLLSDRLALAAQRVDGHAKDFAHFAGLLAMSVVDANNEPLFTRDEWEVWGARHYAATLKIWDVAYELSGLGQESAEKNSEARSSDSP